MAFNPSVQQLPGSGRNERLREHAAQLQQQGVQVVAGPGAVIQGRQVVYGGQQPLPVQVVPVAPVHQPGVPLAAQGRVVQQPRDVPLARQNLPFNRYQ